MINKDNLLKSSLVAKDISELFSIASNKKYPFNFRHDAIIALGKIGKKAISKLTIIIHDPSPEYRQAAIRSIGSMGSSAKKAIPALTNCLKDIDEAVRVEADLALCKIGRKAFSVLKKILKDKWSGSGQTY